MLAVRPIPTHPEHLLVLTGAQLQPFSGTDRGAKFAQAVADVALGKEPE
jgi:hypothetical protein